MDVAAAELITVGTVQTRPSTASGAEFVDDSAAADLITVDAVQTIPPTANDHNLDGVRLPVHEPLLPPHASTETGISSEVYPVKGLFGDGDDSSQVHGLETRPSISSRPELVDVAAAELITVGTVQTRPPTASGAECVDDSVIYGNLYNKFHGNDDMNDHDHSVLDEVDDDELADVVNGVIRDQSLGERSHDFNKNLAYILAHNAVPNDVVVPEGLTEDNLCIAYETVEQYRHNDEFEDREALLKSIQEFAFSKSFTGRRTSKNAWRCSLSSNSNATKKGKTRYVTKGYLNLCNITYSFLFSTMRSGHTCEKRIFFVHSLPVQNYVLPSQEHFAKETNCHCKSLP